VISNEAAREKLASLADEFLCHDREIFMRVDDSVVRRDGIIRRARGYAPDPFDLGYEAGEVLACGGELKNTFCLTKGRYAILSQHIGDLENLETLEFFEETLRNLKKVYRAEPRLVAHDLHPDYLSTRWALRQPEPRIAVQHHWAHIASCMAENHLRGPVIGVAWDGTGYGTDRQIWGGEFLVCDYERFERVAHFRYVPLVGGDKAARECWRIAAAHLHDAFGTDFLRYIEVPKVFETLLARATLKTSSSGRLFDAVSAITGVCRENTYEGEAAMLLEAAAAREEFGEFPFRLEDGVIDTRPMIRAIAEEHDPAVVSSRFHSTLASIITKVALEVRERTGIAQVCFSGGTFQNRTLVRRVVPRLEDLGFQVFTQKQVPPNDGGLALGQAAIAAACLTKRRTV
jgi:hydrogenase maturation protein HypF